VISALEVCTKRRAIIARRSSISFWWSFNFSFPATLHGLLARRKAKQRSGGKMTLYDPTLYGRDEEEEFGDTGAYSESLEEDFEEEEEEESGIPEPEMKEPATPAPPPPAPKPTSGGGGGPKKPVAKKKAPAKKAPAKRKAPKKPAKKKAAKKPAKKKAAKKPAKKAKKKAKKGRR
jgi:outer membrane biosynthesis protein TonB